MFGQSDVTNSNSNGVKEMIENNVIRSAVEHPRSVRGPASGSVIGFNARAKSLGEYARTRRHLRWLCTDMIQRLEDETSEELIGDIGPRVEEAGRLALSIGFAMPPIQEIRYGPLGGLEFSPQGGDEQKPSFSRLVSLLLGETIASLFGYRIYDPTGGFEDVTQGASSLSIQEDGAGFMFEALPEGYSLSQARAVIIKMLKRWGSAIDGLPDEVVAEGAQERENQ